MSRFQHFKQKSNDVHKLFYGKRLQFSREYGLSTEHCKQKQCHKKCNVFKVLHKLLREDKDKQKLYSTNISRQTQYRANIDKCVCNGMLQLTWTLLQFDEILLWILLSFKLSMRLSLDSQTSCTPKSQQTLFAISC